LRRVKEGQTKHVHGLALIFTSATDAAAFFKTCNPIIKL